MSEQIHIEDLLKAQQETADTATIEPVADDNTIVKVTPWRKRGGCVCQHALVVPKDAIKELRLVGDTHDCCGQSLQVVAVTFADSTWAGVFRQMTEKARSLASAPIEPAMVSGRSRYIAQASRTYRSADCDPSDPDCQPLPSCRDIVEQEYDSCMAYARDEHDTCQCHNFHVLGLRRCGVHGGNYKWCPPPDSFLARFQPYR